MGRKNNRVRHGQFRTDVPAATDTADAAGEEIGLAGSTAVEPAQPAADAGDGSANADLLDAGGIDGGNEAAEANSVSVVVETGQPAENQAGDVSYGQAEEAPGDGGEDTAASGGGVADSAGGNGPEPVADAAAGLTEPQPGAGAGSDWIDDAIASSIAADGTDGLHSGEPLVHEGTAAADVAEPEPSVGTDKATLIPSAQAWQPNTVIDRAAMAAAASMNEAFWVLMETSNPWNDQQERIHGNYALWRPAAEFVIANRDAPADAIAIHLAIKKIGGTMTPEPVEITLWNVFKTVFLLVHDALVDADRQAAVVEPVAAQAWPGDLAMQPQPSAFDPAGFSPRR